ncbi:kinase-like domain-containing protein, partial [Hyaloraphidium curvatum]
PEVPPEDAPQDAPQDQQTSKPRSGGGSFPVLPANEIARGNLPKGLLTPLALKPITDFYADESSLGKGHYGSVSKVGLIGSVEARQPAIFALKTLNYFQKTNDGDIIPNSENRFAGDNEDELFLKINGGPFVVRSYGSWKETDPEDPIKTVKKTVYGLASGDLTKHLKDLSFDDTRQTFARIVYGLAFLHTNGIVHKDLKAANILVGFDGMPRIGDFGSATFRRNLVAGTGKNKFCVYTGSGDGAVRAPEVSVVFNRLHLAQRAAIRGGNEEEWLEEAAETDCATESADIFALGVILYQMVTGGQSGECRVGEYAGLHLPHIKGNKVCGLVDWDRMLEDISEKQDTSFLDLTNLSPSPKFKYPKDLQNARDLITRLMHPDPRRRLGASTLQGPRPRKGWVTDTLKILEHPFFSAPVHPDLKPITLQDLRAAGEAVGCASGVGRRTAETDRRHVVPRRRRWTRCPCSSCPASWRTSPGRRGSSSSGSWRALRRTRTRGSTASPTSRRSASRTSSSTARRKTTRTTRTAASSTTTAPAKARSSRRGTRKPGRTPGRRSRAASRTADPSRATRGTGSFRRTTSTRTYPPTTRTTRSRPRTTDGGCCGKMCPIPIV